MFNQIIRYKPIINFIKENKPNKILEVWSWSKWIWKFMKNLKFTWLDQTTTDYWINENKTSKNMEFINWDSLNMPFNENNFDLVFSLDMLEHIKPEKRLDAIKEIVRVSNKYCIIAFPYWKFWSLIDELFNEYYSEKDWKVEWWLKEHIENWVPNKDLINSVKNEFKNYEVKEFLNWNIFFVIFIILLESKFLFNIILIQLSYILAYLPINFNSKYWVRKFLIITKKY